jgi:hypothetical protein
VIGRDWISFPDETGARRLDNPRDFVRIEIRAALQRDIPVIPILMNGTKVPRLDQLPEDIAPLAMRNGLEVRHSSFHPDLDRLVRELKPTTPDKTPTLPSPPKILKPDQLRGRLIDAGLWIVGSIMGFAGVYPILIFMDLMLTQGHTGWSYIIPGIFALTFAGSLVLSRPEKRLPSVPIVGMLAMALSCSLLLSFVSGPDREQMLYLNLLWLHPLLTALLIGVSIFMRRMRDPSIRPPEGGDT